jgi:SAM-dependent methyltransferase
MKQMSGLMSAPLKFVREHGPSALSVIECGTRRWGTEPTHHQHFFPNATEYVMTDFMEGEDVDVVSDVHDLKEFADNSFDVFFSSSLFEHVEYPWLAAQAIFRVLKPGGWCYTATHQTFPVHGYPSDYTRWTDNGLSAVFRYAGFEIYTADMSNPCKIVPPETVTVWDEMAPAYIGVSTIAIKPSSKQSE